MTDPPDILEKLKGTDRRSLGDSRAVIAAVLANPTLFKRVFEGILTDDPVQRMRSADVVEKISGGRPDLLQPFKTQLLGSAAHCPQAEVRWHIAQLLPRLDLDPAEADLAASILKEYLRDDSRIVRTFALQGLADLARRNPGLLPDVWVYIEKALQTGSPAEKSRSRRIIKSFKSTKKTGN